MGLTSIVGDYDAIVVPLLLQKSRVRALLPVLFEDDLLPTTYVNKILQPEIPIPQDMHPILFVFGRQSKCGPSVLPGKMSFQEAKLEVPFMRHIMTDSEKAHCYKCMLMFDSRLMTLASQHVAGLRSRRREFFPSHYSSFDTTGAEQTPESDAILYEIVRVLQLRETNSATPASVSGLDSNFVAPLALGESAVKALLGLPWFGENTGETVSQFVFDWDSAPRPLERFHANFKLILLPFSELEEFEPPESEDDWTIFSNIIAYRFRASFVTV